jgi:Tol biopolymer transport system component
VALGEFIDEGPAVSRTRLHVAWTAPGQRDIYEADVVYRDGTPSLANKRLVLSYADRPMSRRLEPQDFRPPDERELLFSDYGGTLEEPFYFSDVCGVELASGRVTNYTKTPEQYDEAEGVFPDGRYTLVESDRHGVNRKWKIDIYRLGLGGDNHADRITYFDGIPGGYHGSNPVVSDDGRLMVVQIGIHGSGAGQGRGLVLVDLAQWEKTLPRR